MYQMMLKEFNPFSAGDPSGEGLLNDILLPVCLLSCSNEDIIQYGFAVIQWKIAWSLEL
jgi:hypothetical protein